MIADLNTALAPQTETEPTYATTKTKRTPLVSTIVKLKQLSSWLNPKNWFSCFSTIEIDMSEFACKKTLPKV